MIAAAPGDEIVENRSFICVLYGKERMDLKSGSRANTKELFRIKKYYGFLY